MIARVLLPATSALLLLGSLEPRSAADPARLLLASAFAATGSELARVDAGRVVSRTVTASDPREVATLGIVRIGVTPEAYVERLANVATFKRDAAVLQIGAFADPAGLPDVAGLTLEESDVRSLRECRVGSCGVQLSAEAIERFRREIDWHRPDASRQANDLMRRIVVEYVSRYRRGGAAAAMQYADGPEPLDVRHEFASLVTSTTLGWRLFPRLVQHLVEYPASQAQPVVDVFYWSKERVGRRAVVSITHLAIARTGGNSPADYAIASKQIYGSHYFDASLGLTVLVRDQSIGASATYLAYFNRSRVDVFRGPFGGLTRRLVTSRARSTVADQLERLKRRLEETEADSQAW